MTETTFATTPGMPPNSLSEYGIHKDQHILLDGFFHPSVMGASGAMITTPSNLNTFQRALATGTLLSPAMVERMRQIPVEGSNLGMGVIREDDVCGSDGKTGWLYGHDGLSYGTSSWSFASADGRRSVTIAATGVNLDNQKSPDNSAFISEALRQACTITTSAPKP